MILAMAVVAVNAQRTPVKAGDLPKPVSEYLTKSFPGFTVKEAIKEVTNNVTTYEVTAVKGTTQETMIFDNAGKFLKKVTAKEGTVEKKNPTPPAQSKPPVEKKPVKK